MIAGKGGGRAGLQSGNAKELVGPHHFVRVAVPSPAANRRQSLRFPKLRLLPAQRFFRVFALGDVDARSDIAVQGAIQREPRHASIEYPSVLAVVPPEAIFHLERLAPSERRGQNLEPLGQVVGMDRITPSVAEECFQPATGERHPWCVDVGAAFVVVRHPDQDRDDVCREPEGLVACTPCLARRTT
jgi:hypothetical protein